MVREEKHCDNLEFVKRIFYNTVVGTKLFHFDNTVY
jgi:hypothetical protein